MLDSPLGLDLCVQGRPLPAYLHQGSNYVEGRAGTPYAVRLRNRSGRRIEVVLTVDGINVITGKEGSFDGDGYVLAPYQTSDIRGFLRSGGKAAAFTFGGRAESYREKLGRGGEHLGVVGAAVFEEKVTRVPTSKTVVVMPATVMRRPPCKPRAFPPTFPYGEATITWEESGNSFVRGYGANDIYYSTAVPGDDAPRASAQGLSVQNLGTEYGAEVDFATHSVRFRRSSKTPAAVVEVFYDDAEGLRERGIEVGKVKPTAPRPSAFPEDAIGGCPAPAGWTP